MVGKLLMFLLGTLFIGTISGSTIESRKSPVATDQGSIGQNEGPVDLGTKVPSFGRSIGTQENLKILWNKLEMKIENLNELDLFQDTSEKIIDPPCDTVHVVESTYGKYSLRLGFRPHHCQFTIQSKSYAYKYIICASVQPDPVWVECEDDIHVFRSTSSTIMCGNKKLMDLPMLKSELEFIQCALIIGDTIKPSIGTSNDDNTKGTTPRQPCPQCGLRQIDSFPLPRIVGGQAARVGEFPWQAYIVSKGDNDTYQLCGGSLLNSKFILSAAHCFKQEEWTSTMFVIVVLGLQNLDEIHSKDVVLQQAVKIHVHPGYEMTSTNVVNDIAILELSLNVKFTDRISPVCLADLETNYSNSKALISGYGVTAYDPSEAEPDLPMKLLKGHVSIVPGWACKIPYKIYNIHINSDKQVCTRGLSEESCKGDSGGPVVVRHDDGRFVQVGIVSWGFGCSDVLAPTVNTRVAGYRNWIAEVTSSGNCDRN